jgi:hypothetical protein
LGHFYGCFSQLESVVEYPMFFVINDLTDVGNDTLQTSIRDIVLDAIAFSRIVGRSVFCLRESHLRPIIAPVFRELLLSTRFRLLSEAFPQHQTVRRGQFLGSLDAFLFPVHQTAYTAALNAEIASFNDDNLRIVAFGRKAIRRLNAKFSRNLPETVLLKRNPGRLNGCDGRRMSKGYGNCISAHSSEDDVRRFSRKLVGYSNAGEPDFDQKPPGQLERAFYKICLCQAPGEEIKGLARIAYLADCLASFQRKIRQSVPFTDDAHREDWAVTLADGERIASERVFQTMRSSNYTV